MAPVQARLAPRGLGAEFFAISTGMLAAFQIVTPCKQPAPALSPPPPHLPSKVLLAHTTHIPLGTRVCCSRQLTADDCRFVGSPADAMGVFAEATSLAALGEATGALGIFSFFWCWLRVPLNDKDSRHMELARPAGAPGGGEEEDGGEQARLLMAPGEEEEEGVESRASASNAKAR